MQVNRFENILMLSLGACLTALVLAMLLALELSYRLDDARATLSDDAEILMRYRVECRP